MSRRGIRFAIWLILMGAAGVLAVDGAASSTNPKNKIDTGDPSKDGTVKINVNGAAGSVSFGPYDVKGDWDANSKAQNLADLINTDDKNLKPDGSKKYNASVSGNTITITNKSDGSAVRSVNISPNKTKEKDDVHGLINTAPETGWLAFSGPTAGAGSITVQVDEYTATFAISGYATIASLRSAVASDLTGHGYSSVVQADGKISVNLPSGANRIGLQVDSEVMNADMVGFDD